MTQRRSATFKTLAILILIGASIIFAAWWVWSFVLLPSKSIADNFPIHEKIVFNEAIVIKDRFGVDLGKSFDENREIVSLNEVSPVFVNTLLVSEDKNFFKHDGFYLPGMLRAMAVNLKNLKWMQGGSTITQQLAKNLMDRRGKTLHKKIVELFLALRLEKELSKEEILTLYLNRVFFGNGYFGVEAASKGYFGHSAFTLDRSQSALLVSMIQAPSLLSPYKRRDELNLKADRLLQRVDAVFPMSGKSLNVRDVRFLPKIQQVNGVKSYPSARAISLRDLEPGDEVSTTIDGDKQRALEGFAKKMDTGFAAGIIDLKSGDILAYVGGRDFLKEQYDRFFDSRRNTGALLFPVTADINLLQQQPFLPAYPGSFTRIHVQDALSILWRPSLADDRVAGIAEVLGLVRSMAGYDSTLYFFSDDSTKTSARGGKSKMLDVLYQARGPMAGNGVGFFSASLGCTDGWGFWLNSNYAMVCWIGEDKPKVLGPPEEIEERVGTIMNDLVGLLALDGPSIVSQPALHVVNRNTGEKVGDFAGSLQTPIAPLDVTPPKFLPPLHGPVVRTVNKLTISEPKLPTSFMLPAPRPIIESFDGVSLATSPMFSAYYFFWPRPEMFESDSLLIEFVRSMGVFDNPDKAFATRKMLPSPIAPALISSVPKDFVVEWPAFGREYPFLDTYRNIIGMAGPEQIPAEDLAGNTPLYTLFKGRFGLEKWLDDDPRFAHGSVTFFQDLFGFPQDTALSPPSVIPPIKLTLSHVWQQEAVKAMQDIDKGALVLMDCETGAVRAMVSKPLTDEFNRCVSGVYPAGSAIKPFVAAAAFQTLGQCPIYELGPLDLEGVVFDFGESGQATLEQSMIASFNSYFINLAQDVGSDGLINMYREAGFAAPAALGVFLPPRQSSLWSRRLVSVGGAELANLAMGQGDFLTTPLQMARAYGWLATRGRLVKPRLLEAERVKNIQTKGIDSLHWLELSKALKGVVGSGTGAGAYISGFKSLHGKTGTAQVGQKGNYSYAAWFCGFVVLDSRLHSFAVVVEGEPGQALTGGKNAAPIVRKLLSGLSKLGVVEGDDPLIDESADITEPVPTVGQQREIPLADDLMIRQFTR